MKVFKKLFVNNSMARIANDFIQICTQQEEEAAAAGGREIRQNVHPEVIVEEHDPINEALFDVPTPEAKRKSFDTASAPLCRCYLKPVDNRIPKLSVTSMECPICFEDFKPSSKIYQCMNGHLYCDGCKPKLVSLSCPQCRQDIPEDGIRNVFLERIIQRLHQKQP